MLTPQKARDLRFADGLTCLVCQSPAIKWGKERDGTQRYRCKACQKTFNDHTGTPVACSRKKSAWRRFSDGLSLGLTAAKTGVLAGVNRKTAYAWRRKVLGAAVARQPGLLTGVVEADETYLRRSYKGGKVQGRRPRKRGGQGSKRGLGRDKVAIIMACDRRGSTHAVQVPGTATIQAVASALSATVATSATLVTDGGAALAGAAKQLGLQHVALNTSRRVRKRGIYHTNTVSAAHNEFKAFLYGFRGVSTAQLPLYLAWFRSRKELGASLPVLPTATGPCPTCGR